MAYNAANLRKMVMAGIDNSVAGGIWFYTSADAVATVVAQNYITNPIDQGMLPNDLVFIFDTNTPLISTSRVKTVGAAGVGALLSTGITVGNT